MTQTHTTANNDTRLNLSKNKQAGSFITQLHTPQGFVHIYANAEAITHITFADESAIENPNQISEQAKVQIKEYLAGQRHHFTLPLAPYGTEFQRMVWQQLLNVGYGQTASYLSIATAINKPKACRAVGAANGKNPIAIVIPCHRIIGANGSLTGYASGLTRKSFLLDLES